MTANATETRRRKSSKATPTVDAVKSILPAARRYDRARAKLDALPSREKAKQAFDLASRNAQLNPSPENLAAVQAAIRDLNAGGGRRQKLETEHAAAELALRASISTLVDRLKTALPKAA